MASLLSTRIFGHKIGDVPTLLVSALPDSQESRVMKTVGWLTAAVGALALGLFVGRELRQRYKFNRRTPYDFYAHSGDLYSSTDDFNEADFGLGI